MGQKVNPHGLRVGVIKDWESRWYAREDKVGDLIVEDYKIRQYLKKTLYSAGVPTIEIERDSAKVRIYIHCSRPGVVIGKGGAEIERIRKEVEKMLGKPVAISIVEVRTPDTNAQLVAENIAQHFLHFLAKALYLSTALADDNTGSGAVDVDADLSRIALYFDGGNTGGIEGLLQILTNFVVFNNKITDLIFSGVPSGIPVFDNAYTQAVRINFLSHNSASFPYSFSATSTMMWLVRLFIRYIRP